RPPRRLGRLSIVQAAGSNHHQTRSRILPRRRDRMEPQKCVHALVLSQGRRRFYCAFGLIAQDTFTDTESVSSPCATGAPAAMGAAILPRNAGTGAPSSEILIGSPSV